MDLYKEIQDTDFVVELHIRHGKNARLLFRFFQQKTRLKSCKLAPDLTPIFCTKEFYLFASYLCYKHQKSLNLTY